jgi:hypothetical protein
MARPKPVITARTPTRVCEGDSVALEASEGYVGYEWSNGQSGRSVYATVSGVYTVTVTDDNGCRGESNGIEVTIVSPPPKPVITRIGDALQSSEASAYQWYKDGVVLPGVTGRNFTPPASGSYSVRVYNADGCWRDSDPVLLTSVATALPSPSVPQVYPDPTSGRVTVHGIVPAAGGAEITVTNILGQVMDRIVDRHARGVYTRDIDLSAFPRGVYLLQLRFADVLIVRRVVKQ